MSTATQSIREIVATQASAATVLQWFQIDLCSQASQSLSQACANLQLSVDQVLEKLEVARADEAGAPPIYPASMSLEKLLQHIVRVHHKRVRQEMPRLAAIAHKIAGKHGDRAPALIEVDKLMDELQGDLIAHIEKEENVLFPYIAHLDQQLSIGVPSAGRFRRVSQPVRMMMNDHVSATRIFSALKRLTNGFEPPSWACATQVSLHTGLRAFEADLKQHIHLEDDVLFPRAIELEDSIGARVEA